MGRSTFWLLAFLALAAAARAPRAVGTTEVDPAAAVIEAGALDGVGVGNGHEQCIDLSNDAGPDGISEHDDASAAIYAAKLELDSVPTESGTASTIPAGKNAHQYQGEIWGEPDDLHVSISGESLCMISSKMTDAGSFSGGAVSCSSLDGKGRSTLLDATFGTDAQIAQVSCGNRGLCCALEHLNGVAWCWDSTGLALESPSEPLVQVSVSNSFACGIEAVTLLPVCWTLQGRINAPAVLDTSTAAALLQLSCGASHCCGIRESDGQAECWGDNSKHQLDRLVSLGPRGLAQISAGKDGDFTVAVEHGSGHVLGWGDDSFGQVSRVPRSLIFAQVTAGDHFACGIELGTGKLHCWGRITSLFLEKGMKAYADRHQASPKFRSISAGDSKLCGKTVDEGHVLCFPSSIAVL